MTGRRRARDAQHAHSGSGTARTRGPGIVNTAPAAAETTGTTSAARYDERA